MNETYARSDRWRILAADSLVVLENGLGGRIVIDDTLKDLIEGIDHQTFEEIDAKRIVSSRLLKAVLKTMTRVGVLETSQEMGFEAGTVAKECATVGTPQVSIVIVNHNGEEHLPELLKSIERQSYQNIEILIVDNNSSDRSRTLVQNRGAAARLLEMKKNVGFACGVNIGLAQACGEYILLLNNDTVLDESAVRELVKVAQRYENWAAISPKILYYNNRCFINSLGNAVRDHDWGSDNFFGFLDLGQFDQVTETPSACFAAALLNGTVVKRIGGLDQFYRYYYEDADWCYRAQFRGHPVYTAPSAVVYHKFGASVNKKAESFKLRYVVGNRLYFACKNLEWRTLKQCLSNYLYEDLNASRYLLGQRDYRLLIAYLRGYLRFLGSFPVLIRKRRNIQKTRSRLSDSSLLLNDKRPGVGLMYNGMPVLSTEAIQLYYMGPDGS